MCPKCLCAPCIIERPPHFLRGTCDPHPANAEKRHMLYKKFWRCLNHLGLWQDEEYLRRKATRTVRDDRRDIMPDCVIDVRKSIIINISLITPLLLYMQDIRRRYPSHDGLYRDYLSTFDASVDYDSVDNDSVDNVDDDNSMI